MYKIGSRVKVVGDCRLPLGTIAIIEAYSETVNEYYIRNEISDYTCWVKLEVIEPYDDRSNEEEIYKRYPGWKELETFSDTRIFAIWQSIVQRETVAKAKNKVLQELEKGGLYLKPSDGRYGDEQFHQITIEEYLKEVAQ